jgi:hypothetical protein
MAPRTISGSQNERCSTWSPFFSARRWLAAGINDRVISVTLEIC